MTSRRAVLSGLGTIGAISLAGCSALPFGGDGDEVREDVSLSPDDFEQVAWPESPFPVLIPPTLADAHRTRARELLATVPIDPSVRNGAIAEQLQSERERAANQLVKPVDEPWPIRGLSRWRNRLNTAATVRGAYRAATGEDDAAIVTDRRQSVREDLASFVADHQYRASSAIEAVLVHSPIEDMIADCRRRTRPRPAYPVDPVDRPFQAGDAIGRVELARATLADAQVLRAMYLGERATTPSQWGTLIEAMDRLRMAAARTRSRVQDFLDVDEPPFDADLEGTAGRTLFMRASRNVEATTREYEERHDDGDYAMAVITVGRMLAAVETLQTAIEGIRNGAYQDPVTVESVSRTADRAQEAIAAIEASEDRRLAAKLAWNAVQIVDYTPEYIERGYYDAAEIHGELARAELYARAVPAATEFVINRL